MPPHRRATHFAPTRSVVERRPPSPNFCHKVEPVPESVQATARPERPVHNPREPRAFGLALCCTELTARSHEARLQIGLRKLYARAPGDPTRRRRVSAPVQTSTDVGLRHARRSRAAAHAGVAECRRIISIVQFCANPGTGNVKPRALCDDTYDQAGINQRHRCASRNRTPDQASGRARPRGVPAVYGPRRNPPCQHRYTGVN